MSYFCVYLLYHWGYISKTISKVGVSEKMYQVGMATWRMSSIEKGSNLLHTMALEHTSVFSSPKSSNASIIYTVGNGRGQIYQNCQLQFHIWF